jgi:ribosomal protein S18 acetylase RimI-like enzyme
MPVIRRMQTSDIEAVMQIQIRCYQPHYNEPQSVLQQRLLQSPHTAWVAEDEQGICSYLVGYLSVLGKVTALQSIFQPSDHPNTLYLHDLAVHPRVNGQGVAASLVSQAVQSAQQQQMQYLALVAVQESYGFWQRHGFRTMTTLESDQCLLLDTYGESACYMQRTVVV